MWIFGFPKYKAQTVWMIVKNHNVLHLLAGSRICRRNLYRLPNDENPLCMDARLSAWRAISGQTSLRIGDRPNEGWRKDDPSMVRAFPFHESCYDRSPGRRYGACVGFCSVTCEAMLTPSFEVNESSATNAESMIRCECYFRLKRTFFAARQQPWGKPVVAALLPAAELKPPSLLRSRDALRYKSRSFLACAR